MNREAKKWLRFRLASLMAVFLVLFIALVSRAFQLQILSGTTLKSLAERQHVKTLQVPPERGIIFDRNGEKLAVSVMADSVCADPAKITRAGDTAAKLAAILDQDAGQIRRKLSRKGNFCWIARRIPPDRAARVVALNIDGVFLIQEPKRFYPSGELAGHLLGFVGTDASGLEGIEMLYDRHLMGAPRKLTRARDAKGKPLYARVETVAVTPEESRNLILTIDSRIQYLAEQRLKEAVLDKGAKGGYAIVMDPRTGEILALANQMTFDPNNFGKFGHQVWKNKAITDCYDPGSTFKPFLVAAALEERVVRENDRFYCENGAYAVADRVFHEAQRKRHGTLTVHDILKYSSNIGSIKISERLGKEKFYEYIQKFGFGAKTGIDLPGEVPGLLRPVQNWTRVDASTVAFGQGVSVTAIQLITALSAVANGGVLMKPYIVRAIVDRKGQIIQSNSPQPVRRVVSPATARRLGAMLTDVVGEEDGTGKRARIENVSVAGKTGTSQKYDTARHVYSSERVRTSFMGFFPAEDPQVAILITLDEPQRDKWGGVAAAPVFKGIGEQILACFKSHLRESPAPAPSPQDSAPPAHRLTLVSASRTLPIPGTAVSGAEESTIDEAVMPDFRGLTIRDALKRARERNIRLRVLGSGWALNQAPSPGTPLVGERLCTVSFHTGD
ncbi:MAG: penicillin-binding transpeptidase domain-containing protein [Syntrophales bacterium]|nr:penicillin-binding transpeptidase domain-containing protein [Syntrophales bacterium]MDD4338048.1 penicillin-binding transpeptidase domain-containing protein [Syntrophales bacterium]HOG07452.1 penicillin-binding transpeptidase domain-containing protein [Syntrophales bacterium]HPB70003.1 penicillin-binding transpeptidase domain-containing protein [Syntrophales bacterium]HQN25826.1 penicillin-binding transpeptidase domain-containing protein [Syntrophales bacterium]